MAPKPQHPKGTKELCAALLEIANNNLAAADEEDAAGDHEAAWESIQAAQSALNDHSKWRCGDKKAARVRKGMAVLWRAKRGRSPARSRR
jgi:hypothetical protein